MKFALSPIDMAMNKRTTVVNIMTANPSCVNINDSLLDIVTIFETQPIHHIPIVSGNKLQGIISKTDMERVSFISDYEEDNVATSVYAGLSIKQVMTKQLKTVQTNTTIREAAMLLAQGSYHALPVLENNNLVGIVTSTDIIQYLLDQY